MSSITDMPTPTGPGSVAGAPEPPGRVHRHVHQPLRRHRRRAPARRHRRRGPAAAAGARLARDLVRLAPGDAGAGPGLHGHRRRPARHRAVRQARRRVRHRHPRQRPGRADGRARPRAVRRGRPRHRVRDQLRAGRGPPGPGRPRGPRRDPRTPGAGRLTARCSSPARSTTGSGTSRSTGSRDCPSSSSRDARTSTSATSSPSRAARCPTSSSTTTSVSSPTPTSLRGSLGFYRAFDATLAQNDERASRPLTMPVLAIGGEASYGEHVAEAMAAARRRRPDRGHPRRRPLGRRAGARRAAGRADRVPRPVPRGGRRQRTLGQSVRSPADRVRTASACPRSAGRPSGSTPSHSAPPSCAATSSS